MPISPNPSAFLLLWMLILKASWVNFLWFKLPLGLFPWHPTCDSCKVWVLNHPISDSLLCLSPWWAWTLLVPLMRHCPLKMPLDLVIYRRWSKLETGRKCWSPNASHIHEKEKFLIIPQTTKEEQFKLYFSEVLGIEVASLWKVL